MLNPARARQSLFYAAFNSYSPGHLACLIVLFFVAALFIPLFTQNAPVAGYQQQFKVAQEDPSFLYETRYIPDNKPQEEFLTPELQKEIIVEQGKREEEAAKIDLKLPNTTQTLVIIGVVILFLLYRFQVKKAQKSGSYKRR